MKKNLHLICNAHIDPVWMWEIGEGVAETLSTFRVAADFCEEYDGFVFCHNEAMLYEWVEKNDPALFARIKKLVKDGKWHIMGGWYLQPDCNIPSGESIARGILLGKYYFMEKFGVDPKTAINFDAFGHSRGLVAIIKKAGYDSYICCRPEPDMLSLPAEDFNWVGFDGSKIAVHRAYNSYESHRGEADKKIRGYIERNRGKSTGLVLWGIGNHGGGPSRIDLEKIEELMRVENEFNIVHSVPEAYFAELKTKEELPDYDGLMNPRYTGCYTTMARIKALHRKLENELYMTEKMASHAAIAGLLDYPAEKLTAATKDLMMLEFHDILPGTSVEPVEKYATALAGHALTELNEIKLSSFLSLCRDKKKAEDGTIPVFVYNPHPYEVEKTVEVEFMLPDQNKDPAHFALPEVYQNGEKLASQCEHEISNFNVDWRKHIVFRAKLAPSAMTRFDVAISLIPTPAERKAFDGKVFTFKNDRMEVRINLKTGLIDKYIVDGKEYLKANALRPIVVADDENSWAHKERAFRKVIGEFSLMSDKRGTAFSGITDGHIEKSVRIIEDGDIRTVVEALFEYGDSMLCRRYYLSKTGAEIKISDKVYWNEKMKMLKLSVPTLLVKGNYIGEQAYGYEKLLANGEEMVSGKWNMVVGKENALSVINSSTHGSDFFEGEMRITYLRSPGYSAGKSDFSVRKPYIMEQDRFSPFIDQGEHDFTLVISGGNVGERLDAIAREASVFSEEPTALSFFPAGIEEGKENTIKEIATLSDEVITLTALKKAERGIGYIVRLFNPTETERKTTLTMPSLKIKEELTLAPFEIATYRVNPRNKDVSKTSLIER